MYKRVFFYTTVLCIGLLIGPAAHCRTTTPKKSHSLPTNYTAPSATQLGWVSEPHNHSLCHGFYKISLSPYIPNPRIRYQTDNYDIKSDQTLYSLKGISTLTGHVDITQPGRELTSDSAYLYPNKKTGGMKRVETLGNVHLKTANQLVIAKEASMNLKTRLVSLKHIIYRMALGAKKTTKFIHPKTKKIETNSHQLNAWGTANSASQIKHGVLNLKTASYTTCPPTGKTCWHVRASTIQLNSNSGRGYAVNARLYIRKLPIFYFPYFNFPINKKRQSGFLLPSYGQGKSTGFSLALPYYWNIAPNYDDTITPQIMMQRGILLTNLFRYLTPQSVGNVQVSIIPGDKGFETFQHTAKTKWQTRPTYDQLEQDSSTRTSFHWLNKTQFNPHWSSNINYNYTSDDYFTRDYGDNLLDNSNNQLLRQGEISYANDTWQFLANLQSYQTLHPVDQADVLNQYARFPQLQLNAESLNNPYGAEYDLTSEYDYFTMARNPQSPTAPVIGSRYSLRPAASLPLTWPFAYLTPRIQLQMTQYNLHQTPAYQAQNPGVAMPIFDVKSGLYFDRSAHLLGHSFQQTLEPEVYYLYVPYHDQNKLPLFDTSLQNFSYNLLFDDNRFSGIDRIGDTNRISIGVTTRFLNANTGSQAAKFSIGQIHYLAKRKTTRCSGLNCPASFTNRQSTSPIAGLATINLSPKWSATGGVTWDEHERQLNNEDVGLQYKPDKWHIINLNYQYIRGGDVLIGAPANSPENDLKQTNITGYWKLNNHWSFMGRWNYNWSHKIAQAYFAGLTYNQCCWAIRLIEAKTFVGLTPQNHPQYNSAFYMQFVLKGLATLGNNDPGSVVNNITGYVDNFGQIE